MLCVSSDRQWLPSERDGHHTPHRGHYFLVCGSLLISWNQAQDCTKPHQLPVPALDALLNDLYDQIELFIPSRHPYTESLPHARCCAGCLGLAGGDCCPQEEGQSMVGRFLIVWLHVRSSHEGLWNCWWMCFQGRRCHWELRVVRWEVWPGIVTNLQTQLITCDGPERKCFYLAYVHSSYKC